MSTEACWREIGVSGDSSCPELVRHIHCRNCPVHEAAGRQLFTRAAPSGYREAWTRTLAVAPAPEPESRAYLVFRLGAEWLGLRAADCALVSDVRPAHGVPHRSRRVLLGIVNVRGQLLPCVRLSSLLGVTEDGAARARRPRLVVIGEDARSWAFIADEVAGVIAFAVGELGEIPATVAAGLSPFVVATAGWNDHSVGLLETARLAASLEGETLAT